MERKINLFIFFSILFGSLSAGKAPIARATNHTAPLQKPAHPLQKPAQAKKQLTPAEKEKVKKQQEELEKFFKQLESEMKKMKQQAEKKKADQKKKSTQKDDTKKEAARPAPKKVQGPTTVKQVSPSQKKDTTVSPVAPVVKTAHNGTPTK